MGGYAGGNLDENQADRIKTAVFERDGNIVGTLMDDVVSGADDLHGDLRVDAVGASIPLGVFQPSLGNNGSNFGFDFFTEVPATRCSLGSPTSACCCRRACSFSRGRRPLGRRTFRLAWRSIQPNRFTFPIRRRCQALTASRPPQSAIGSGAFTISGTLIPEPATIGLLGIALTVFVAGAIRRRSAVR